MGSSISKNLASKTTWIRLLYMILFAIIYGIAEVVIFGVVVLQLLSALFGGRTNARLRQFGDQLGAFVAQMIRFVTFASETKPFPFSDWPRTTPAPETKNTTPMDTTTSSRAA